MAIVNYECEKCKYKFKRKEEAKAISCPYCGSKVIKEYKPTTANDLLNSVE